MNARTEVITRQPSRPGNGVSRVWRRTIGANVYAFTVVNMPDGELRLFAQVYNGYGDDGTEFGRTTGMRFGCAWSRVHDITLSPSV